MSGGAEANESGLTWESWVKTVASSQGFVIKNHRERANYIVPVAERRVVWTHAPYETIFHNVKEQKPTKTSTEFVVECGSDQVRIECKWQSTSGSVDEKYPFMFLNAVLTMKEPTVVLALGGEYFESGRGKEVRDWLSDSCAHPPAWLSAEVREKLKTRQLMVKNPNNFAKWFRERFPKN